MCGRYTLAPTSLSLFTERFVLAPPPASAASYNVTPGRAIATITQRQGEAPSCDLLHWGLIPSWAASSERAYKMINARAETVTEKRAYSPLLERNRCLIPADGFFEWQSRAGKPKQPWWFHLADANLFSFAGLWTTWKPEPDVEPVNSCTILTVAANAVVSPVHGRMPLILRRVDEAPWIDPAVDAERALAVIAANANDGLLRQPVSRSVNSPRNQGPECIAAVDDDAAENGSSTLF